MINRIQWHGLRFAERLGIIGLLTIAVTLFCQIFIFASWLPTRAALSAMAITKQSQAMQVAKPVATPAENLQNFFGLFPKISERSKHIQAIMSKAKALDLVADDVSYKTEQHADSRLSKTYVDFSVYCTYPEMRVFLNNILTDMPFVSLDQLSINRDDASTELVTIRMRLTLHLVV